MLGLPADASRGAVRRHNPGVPGRVTTLVALVGSAAADAAAAASGAANVTHEPADLDDPAAGWRRARSHTSVYTLIDVDPLGPVVDRWAARLAGGADDLELAIGSLPEVGVPDYYLVDAGLDHPRVDWYLELLESLSPRRVVPVRLRGPAVLDALGRLRFGPEFPSPPELAALSREFVPAAGRGRTL